MNFIPAFSALSRYIVLLTFFSLTVPPCISQGRVYPSNITVAKDGSGDYTSIQAAISAVRAYSPVHITIYIKKGVYHEKVTVPAWVTNISFIGENRDSTIITNADYSGKFKYDTTINKEKFTTFDSYTMYVQGNDVCIENLTIRNTAGRVGQAVALHVDGDRFVIRSCNILGNQDTLLATNDNTRQFYDSCFIEGTTDFIFGSATAIFNQCTIRSLSNSYITAASTMPHQEYGYVFFRCRLIASEDATKVFLGRPWRANAKVVFIDTEMGNHIRPEGWQNWDNKLNESTAYYAEYNSKGPGGIAAKRVEWSHQLTRKQVKKYSVVKIFRGWDGRGCGTARK